MKRSDCTDRQVSRTEETEIGYGSRVDDLRLMAEREDGAGFDIVDFVGWFCAQDDRWAPATVRYYRAAIQHHLDAIPLESGLRASLDARVSEGPTPRDGGQRKTSARKRKSVSRDEVLKLEAVLGASGKPDDLLIRGYLIFGAALFLRPVEYLRARVEGTTLIVPNAKATNGRANGKVRDRDIADMGDRAIASLVMFLDRLRAAATSAGSWKTLLDRLASRLARVCKSLGIARVSLYTMRHVGMATAKSWMEPVEVAAAAGHGSVRTATSHYAKRRTGWVGLRLAGRPSPESVARVRGTAMIFRPRSPTHAIPVGVVVEPPAETDFAVRM